MIHGERVRALNSRRVQAGRYVLYWMQASQRAECNHAIEYAVGEANDLDVPLLVFFGLMDGYPEANARHYRFMLEGLREARSTLAERGIQLVARRGSPEAGATEMARNACLVVVDRGYLRIQRHWRRHVAERIEVPLVQVETDVVVPVETASIKEEYSAATIRRKIHRELDGYLIPLKGRQPRRSSLDIQLDSLDLMDIDQGMDHLDADRSVAPVDIYRGGTTEAVERLEEFLATKLHRYAESRNDPNEDCLSDMSPYLHFGQISPLYIALKVLERGRNEGSDAYLEELIVRRELSMNYVSYNNRYDCLEGLPEWAQRTLEEHSRDPRPHVYTREELENASSHDPYWNAAQDEMRVTGKMHGYMRMYWGKKILEWSASPQEAFDTALYLNNKYELDGRDPNGYTGVAWCFGKHDRPWAERPIFGKIRFMNANGLRRKFDADAYVDRVARLSESHDTL